MQHKLKTIGLTLSIFILLLNVKLPAQSFLDNGDIQIRLSGACAVRVMNPGSDIWQINRLCLLVATGDTNVFDYYNDKEDLDTSRVVVEPLLSDLELYSSCDNSYLDPPRAPAIIEKANVYGWDSGAFILVKFTAINDEPNSIDATLGFEFLPYIDDAEGFETVEYNSESEVVYTHVEASTHIGFKVLSDQVASLKTIDWYDTMYEDSLYYDWLNYGSIDPLYNSETSSGVVSFFSLSQKPTISSGDSVSMWLALAIGSDLTNMLANIDSAVAKYDDIMTTSIEKSENNIVNNYVLRQNYPNPFNPETKISFDLPNSELVSLKVYNLRGQTIATLVNNELSSGSYDFTFNAVNLPSGLYFYELQAGNYVETKKMMLIK